MMMRCKILNHMETTSFTSSQALFILFAYMGLNLLNAFFNS